MENLIPPIYKKLTKTMLTKGNPDCWKELKAFARLFGVDFESDEIQELPLLFVDGTKTTIRFYRVKGSGGRKDCRYSIRAGVLKKQASVGDTIAFSFKRTRISARKVMLIANVTRNKRYTYLTKNEMNWASNG